MTLEEKGPILPPPTLDKYPQKVSDIIQLWGTEHVEVIAATHWNVHACNKPDGADFYVGKEELGHIHLDGEIHLACGKELAAALIKNKLAQKFPWGSDWVQSPIDAAEDVPHATWLFKLNYKRITGTPMDTLLDEVNRYKS